MIFNTQKHDTVTNSGGNAADVFRIAWARSVDGKTWDIDGIIARSADEPNFAPAPCVSRGFLATDFFNEGGYFYVSFTEVGTRSIYLLRSLIDGDPTSVPGYVGWELATEGTEGEVVWTSIDTTQALDMSALNAANMLPSGFASDCYMVRNASFTRMFASAAANSGSYMVAVASAVDCDAGQPVYELFRSDSMSRRFVRASLIDTSSINIGLFGFEPQFTKHVDNFAGTPRVFATEFDLWLVEMIPDAYPNDNIIDGLTIRRRRASIADFEFIFSDGFESGGLGAWVSCPPGCSR